MITGSSNFGDISASDWRCGGIVGEFHEHSASTMTIDYCYNMGTITMSGNGGYACGIVGGASYNSPSGKRTITNVYNGGLVQNTANASNAFEIAFSNTSTTAVTVKNACYISGTGTKNLSAENVTASETLENLISTVITYPVSQENNRFIASASENNGYPVLAHQVTSHENVTVYACGRQYCSDCDKILTTEDEEKHTYTSVTTKPSGYLDGYVTETCSACQAVKKTAQEASAYRPTLTNGVYEIGSVDHLKWYQANLDAGLMSGRESLKLTANLDLKNEAFTPIGTAEHPFSGNFDGAGHTISNLKVESSAHGGFFGVIANAATVSKVAFDGVTVEAELEAGTLFGKTASSAYIKIEWVLITNASVTSKTSSAGVLAGSTSGSTISKFKQCVVDASSAKGAEYAAGLIGCGDSADLVNCYVNVSISAPSRQKSGSLAYYNGNFSFKDCGFVKTATFGKNDGKAVKADDFASGAIANKINSYANEKVYGTNGKTLVMGSPVYAVYYGETMTYTSSLLSDTGDIEVYTDGKTVAIVVKRESDVKLTDLAIKLTTNGKTVDVKFSDLTLTRRVTLSETVSTVSADSALYTLSLAGVSAYEIGTFSGTTVQK